MAQVPVLRLNSIPRGYQQLEGNVVFFPIQYVFVYTVTVIWIYLSRKYKLITDALEEFIILSTINLGIRRAARKSRLTFIARRIFYEFES